MGQDLYLFSIPITIRKAQDEALKTTGCDFHALLGVEGGQRTTISGTHSLETGLLFVLYCFISLVWPFTDDMQTLLIQRKIHIIGCEPLRRQPHSSCQTNLLPYKIIILMRYLRVSQATGSDIRCHVPNHRLCPYLPETSEIHGSH